MDTSKAFLDLMRRQLQNWFPFNIMAKIIYSELHKLITGKNHFIKLNMI